MDVPPIVSDSIFTTSILFVRSVNAGVIWLKAVTTMKFKLIHLLMTVAVIGLFLNLVMLAKTPPKITVSINKDQHELISELPRTYFDQLPTWDPQQNWDPPLRLDLALGLADQLASEMNNETSETDWKPVCVSCLKLSPDGTEQIVCNKFGYFVQFIGASSKNLSDETACVLILMNGQILVGDGKAQESLECIIERLDLHPRFKETDAR